MFNVSSIKFVPFLKMNLMHECEDFINVQGMHEYQQGPFPASAVIQVGFVWICWPTGVLSML
jgi:hypothetical protein